MSVNQIDIVAKTLYGEARGCNMLDRLAVGAVIRERVMRPGWWGTDWVSVCKAPWQFTCWHESDPNYEKILRAPLDQPKVYTALHHLAAYVINDMTDKDVMSLFSVNCPDAIPTHYYSYPVKQPPKAWGTDIQEIKLPWDSQFHFYIVRQGRPKRKGGSIG
jgi:N-acetylmuramoyl-L-alanine amidase